MKLNIQLFASDGAVIIDAELNTKRFDAQIQSLESELERLESTYKKASVGRDEYGTKIVPDEKKMRELREQIEKTSNKLVDLYKKKQILNKKNAFEGLNSGMDGIIKKVGKWALAVFGIRSAYSFVRQSISTLSQYNKNLARDIENIRYGLASALSTVIQKIVEWAYRLMQAVNYIWRKLTGKNLFTNINKNLSSANKNAKELRKTIASFDEMNVIGDNTKASGGGVSNGNITQDLTDTNLLSEDFQKTLDKIAKGIQTIWNILQPVGKWLLEHSEFILALIGTIIGYKLGTKIGALVLKLKKSGSVMKALKGSTAGWAGALVALDAILVGKIIVDIKDKLIPLVEETNKKMEQTKKSLEGNTKQTEKVGDTIVEYANSLDKLNDVQKNNNDMLLKQIDSNKKLIQQKKDDMSISGILTGEIKVQRKAIEELNKQTYINLETLGKLAQNKKLTNEQAEEYIRLADEEINRLEKENQKMPENSKKLSENKEKIKQLKEQLEKTKGTYNVNVKTSADKTNVDNLAKAVNKVEGTHTITLNADTSKANKTVGSWFKDLGKDITNALGFDWSSLKKKFGFAKGGIINMPGKGVPLASAYGGESGAEGVIPLTDAQQMALLGEAIGKYVTINANIVNNMNGRVISRELQKINSENSFANNR